MASCKKSFIMFTALVAAVTLSSSWSGMSLRVEPDDGRHILQSSKNMATATTTPGGGGGLPESKIIRRRIEGTTTEPIRANQNYNDGPPNPPEDDDYVMDPIVDTGDPDPPFIITPEGKVIFKYVPLRPDPPPRLPRRPRLQD